MSGDVFGNGMLLSRSLRLVVAFDHRHVMVDPDPDTETSWAERKRLFELPRSSWADYDTALLSEGGGVWPRTAKAVPLSPQAAAALGLGSRALTVSPPELVRAALRAPVDLLWNGGIGTYVKASGESHGQVGDKTNDALRVDGAELRCRVVGEGGNLGLTQLGRIEAAEHGVRLNTDAIDNAAGVDTSDHEVNIKILLDRLVADGELPGSERDELLVRMTDDVARMVLLHNVQTNQQLGNARQQAVAMLPVHRRFLSRLVADGRLDRRLEFLPDDTELAERQAAGRGLVGPELAVVSAYGKLTLTEALIDSEVPDEPWSQQFLTGYFPPQLRDAYPEQLRAHPLRREIVATTLANRLLNSSGTTFVFRLAEELNSAPDSVVRAWAVAREVFGQEQWQQDVEAADLPTELRLDLHLQFRRLLDRACRWLLQTRPDPLDVQAETDRFVPVVAAMRPRLGDLVVGQLREGSAGRERAMVAGGVPQDLAHRASAFLDEFGLLDVAEICLRDDQEPEVVTEVYFALSERYAVDRVLSRITDLPRDDRWQALARAALRYDLYAALEQLTSVVLRTTEPAPAAQRIATWESHNATSLDRARRTLDDVQELERTDLAPLSVALRTLRTVVKSGSAGDSR